MREETLKKIYNGLLVFAFFNIIVLFVIYRNPDFKLNLNVLKDYSGLIGQAYLTTIYISILSLIISLAFSVILFFMSISKRLYLNYFYSTYTQIALGVPLIVHVIVLYFFFTSAIGIKSPIIAGTLILSGYMSAYFAKTFQGAYEAIDEQQFKIIHILQLPRRVAMKKIIAPQIIKNTLPTLTSHFSLLVKSTALLSLISVPEFTNAINAFNSKTFEFVTGYVVLALGYLLITIPLNYIAKWLNKKVVAR
ncbi:ABC transporter permease subunit [Clostridium sp. B9]|uniref:ABC transporter permease subunit n=1 Tax=Clostridium sp. B9 TaxID=3423224 RepID=UPI003D2F2094